MGTSQEPDSKNQGSTRSQGTSTSAVHGDKRYDFEQRCLRFALAVRMLCRRLPRTLCNQEDVQQLVRCSASVGANYIEANEALGRKDFSHRLRIARKEAKESRFFLQLLDVDDDPELEADRARLTAEANELLLILSAMTRNIGK